MGLLAGDLWDRIRHCQSTDSLLPIGVADYCVPLQWAVKRSLPHAFLVTDGPMCRAVQGRGLSYGSEL